MPEKAWIGYEENFFHWKCGQAPEQAEQGSGRTIILGAVQKTCGCDTWGHGLMVNTVVHGWTIGHDDPKGPFQP